MDGRDFETSNVKNRENDTSEKVEFWGLNKTIWL